jgi:hypothetical protein
MNKRTIVLITALGVAFIAFVLFARSQPGFSAGDVRFLTFFSVFYVVAAIAAVLVWGKRPVQGLFGLPRWVWVVLASWAAGGALLMLLSVAIMPWFGYKGFELMFGNQSLLILIGAAVLMSPFVVKMLK